MTYAQMLLHDGENAPPPSCGFRGGDKRGERLIIYTTMVAGKRCVEMLD